MPSLLFTPSKLNVIQHSHMRVLTLSGWLDTEGESQTLNGVDRLEGKVDKQIVDRETHKSEVGLRNAQFQLLLNRQTDILTDSRILRIVFNDTFSLCIINIIKQIFIEVWFSSHQTAKVFTPW